MEHSKVLSVIKAAYPKLTSAERAAADFFLQNRETGDLSSKAMAAKLYVSEASLSRFAQKCGFAGYREFIYEYQRPYKEGSPYLTFSQATQEVLDRYQELLDRSFHLVDEDQMRRVSQMVSQSRCVYVYGMGSSGFAARELGLRLMRTGLLVEAITDSHTIRMNAVLLDSSVTVVAITLSGRTEEVLWGVREARRRGARVVLITANRDPEVKALADEVVPVAAELSLSAGWQISPQFPILVMVELFFAYYLGCDEFVNRDRYRRTMEALMGEEPEETK